MTALVANVDITDTFDNWRVRTNELAYAMSNLAVTVNSNTAVGNAAITGRFTGNSIAVANSTANVVINPPTAAQKNSGQHYLRADGTWSPNPAYISTTVATTGTAATLIDSFLFTDYSAAEYLIRVKDTSVGGNNHLATKILTFHDDTSEAYSTEYATIYSNNLIASFTANANTSHVKLYITPAVANTTVNFVRISASV